MNEKNNLTKIMTLQDILVEDPSLTLDIDIEARSG